MYAVDTLGRGWADCSEVGFVIQDNRLCCVVNFNDLLIMNGFDDSSGNKVQKLLKCVFASRL